MFPSLFPSKWSNVAPGGRGLSQGGDVSEPHQRSIGNSQQQRRRRRRPRGGDSSGEPVQTPEGERDGATSQTRYVTKGTGEPVTEIAYTGGEAGGGEHV